MRTSCKMILLFAVMLCLACHALAATALGSVTITGTEQSSGSTWDTGIVTATINGISVSFAYGQFSTPTAIASALGALISQKCSMPVYAKASGATLTFYQKGSNTLNSVNIASVSNDPSLFASNSFLVGGSGSWSAPQIAGLSLSQGPPGMGFVITGSGFSTNAQVTVGGLPATIIGTPTSTQITVQVPSGATSSGVIVTVNGYSSSSASFSVVPPFACN